MGYQPGNVRWATPSQNARNRRNNRLITISTITKTLTEWSEFSGISIGILNNRLRRGVNSELLLKPPQYRNKETNNIKYISNIWSKIKIRCYNIKCNHYRNYGGRGIFICSDWKDNFENFKDWILNNLGDRPSPKYQLDRINNDKNYEPGNLRWALPKDNNRNKSDNVFITINGETKTLIEWSEISGVNRFTIKRRLLGGLSDSKLLLPVKRKFDQDILDIIRREITNGESLEHLHRKYKISRRFLTDLAYRRTIYDKK